MLALLVDNLGPSQLAYEVLFEANKWSAENRPISVYYQDRVPPCTPANFFTAHLHHAWNFQGAVISTSLSTTHQLKNFCGPSRRIYYCQDAEWMRSGADFNQLRELLKDTEIVAKGDLAQVLSQAIKPTRRVNGFTLGDIIGA